MGGKSACWNATSQLNIARAFSLSLMRSLMKDSFQASRLETSGVLEVSTLILLTNPRDFGFPSSSAKATRPNPDSPATAAATQQDSVILIRVALRGGDG